MNCQRPTCRQPIRNCPDGCDYPGCRGVQHTGGLHHCQRGRLGDVAVPEPAQPGVTEAPATKPGQEVA